MANLMRRTETRTRAPIFRSFMRIVPQVAAARPVWASPMRRTAHTSTPAFAGAGSGEGGEPQAQVIGAHGGGTCAVSIKVELTLLDAVLHVPAGAVEVLIECPGRPLIGFERGDEEARIGTAVAAARHPLRLGDDPPTARPAVLGRPPEFAINPSGLAADLISLACRMDARPVTA